MASCPAVTADLQEHLGLQRHLAALQARVSKQMAALVDAEARARACAEAAAHRCAAMERALIKERSRAVLACTRWAWGMGGPPPPAVASTPDPAHAPASTATEVLCQTGCQGHGHPWLQADGACRLTGGDCTRVGAPVRVPASEDELARD